MGVFSSPSYIKTTLSIIYVAAAQGGVIGAGFCRYAITTELTLNMNEDRI